MKAKELAEELLKYPDFEVELIYMTFHRDSIHTPFPNVYNYKVKGVADIGHSDRVVVLEGEEI